MKKYFLTGLGILIILLFSIINTNCTHKESVSIEGNWKLDTIVVPTITKRVALVDLNVKFSTKALDISLKIMGTQSANIDTSYSRNYTITNKILKIESPLIPERILKNLDSTIDVVTGTVDTLSANRLVVSTVIKYSTYNIPISMHFSKQ